MGLDMYLYKRVYVKNWDFMKPEERHEVTVKKNGDPLPKHQLDLSKVTYVVQDVCYWRKANAIHQWFVENVQGGNDDCGTYYVSHGQLQELLNIVNKVLDSCELVDGKIHNGTSYEKGEDGKLKAVRIMEDGKYIKDPSVAEELLPTQSGFFFGSTKYDQYYYEDLQLTKAALEEALKDEQGDYEYHSSW